MIILIPSNEGFNSGYDSLGIYSQSPQERERVLNQVAWDLKTDFQNPNIAVLRWDEYLQLRGLRKTQEEYSELGQQKLLGSTRFASFQEEMRQSGRERFAKKGLSVNPDIILQIQEAYTGMYVGEGLAYLDLQNAGVNIIGLNLEEMRIPKYEFLGCDGKIPLVTIAKPSEMTEFYQWKNARIKDRYERRRERVLP